MLVGIIKFSKTILLCIKLKNHEAGDLKFFFVITGKIL